MDDFIQSLRKDFFEEAFDMLQMLETNILDLSNNYEDAEAISEIFRAVHTLKGSAGAVELVDAARYTHRFEDLLDLIRNNEISVNDETIDLLLVAIDNIKELIMAAYEERDFSIDIDKEIDKLNEFSKSRLSGGKDTSTEASADNTPEDSSNVSTQIATAVDGSAIVDLNLDIDSIETIRRLTGDGETVYHVAVDFDTENPMRTVGGVQVFVNLKSLGDIITTYPSLAELEGDEFFAHVVYIVTSEKNPDETKEYITVDEITTNIEVTAFDVDQYLSDLEKQKIAKLEEEARIAEEQAKATAEKTSEETEAKEKKQPVNEGEVKKERVSSFLRVESDRVDEVMNQVGELVINKSGYQRYEEDILSYLTNTSSATSEVRKYFRATIIQILKRLENTLEKQELKSLRTEIFDEFNKRISVIGSGETFLRATLDQYRSSYQVLSRVTSDLQETVMKIRMVPIAQNFNRFPRLIRDLSRDMGKEVNLEISGEDTELDKSVIEVLVDPMVHLIRNAMDHGLEPIEDRIAAGKPKAGTIKLSASHEGNLIIIRVSDDGKGMIPDKIFESAIKKGIVNPTDVLTDKEKLDLIFSAGFSTAEKITNVSGRGVGMDVVKKSLEKINGSISVDTEFGKGSTFSLRIPLTLAIIEALIVEVEGESYSVPLHSIVETLSIDPSSIYEIEGAPTINIRNEIIGVVKLKDIFNLPKSTYEEPNYAVLISFEDIKIALLVNTLVGEQDIVIKALNDKIAKTEGIVGATILGDGRVSFILDIQTIVMSSSIKTTKKNVMRKKIDLKSFIEQLKYREDVTPENIAPVNTYSIPESGSDEADDLNIE